MPQPPPQPVLVLFGNPEERAALKRLLFLKFLVATGRLGRDDLEAER
jgi:hypothetical protein